MSEQLTLAYDRKQIILERSAVSEKLGGQYVDLYDFPDDRWRCAGRASLFPTASSKRTSA